MFVKKGVDFLPRVSLKELENKYNAEKNSKSKIRLQCAILRKSSKTIEEIADVTRKPKTTISDILNRFERKGIGAKDAVKQKGQPKKLSVKNLKELDKALSKKPIASGLPFVVWSTKLVKYFIEKRFGVSYVLMQIHRILRKIKFGMQKQRPEHIKANKEVQRQFKKKLDEELENLIQTDMRSSFWMKAHSNLSHIS